MKQAIKNIVFDLITNKIASSFIILNPIRYYLYRLAGVNTNTKLILKRCYIKSNDISVGKGTFINSYNKFYSSNNGGSITIGNNVSVGMNSLFCTFTHEIGDSTKRAGKELYLPIVVEDGCWIGANATILPGVRIGHGCIIAAGAVVNKNCEPNGLYAGVPAKRVKDLDTDYETKEMQLVNR